MKVVLDLTNDKELKEVINSLIKEEVKSIVRQEYQSIIAEELAKKLKALSTDKEIEGKLKDAFTKEAERVISVDLGRRIAGDYKESTAGNYVKNYIEQVVKEEITKQLYSLATNRPDYTPWTKVNSPPVDYADIKVT